MNIDDLFKIAVEREASDLHLVAGHAPVVRIHGKIQSIPDQPKLTSAQVQDLAFSILTNKQRDNFLENKELDISHEVRGLSRFRVNLHQERGSVGLVARVISTKIPSMEEIDMPTVVKDLLGYDQGLILLTGATGNGKSTSLASMIEYINTQRSSHIVTLEDPTEFIFKSKKSLIRQRQLETDMVSFHQGLVHVLRQDPDVIMVGEMRDLETMATTITLAETGHLVLATLHTHNTSQSIDRIIDSFPGSQQPQIRLQLSLTLLAIVTQRLVPKVGGGRTAAREILLNTPPVANLIRENKIPQIKSVIQTSSKEGMFTMDQGIVDLYNRGAIDKETAQFYLANADLLKE
ncbi:type IV pili twitching motility protein PilT [bacterium]|nr:type IV pili twitching motility protein PilT [bacterium]